MRTLDPEIIIRTILLLSLLFVLITANIVIFVKQDSNRFSLLVFAASLLGFISAFSYMMDNIILQLPFESQFRLSGRISLLLCIITLLVTVSFYLFKKGRAELNAHLLQDLKPVFTTIDDLAVIADYKGVITEVNYPEKLEALAGHGCETIEGLLSALNCKSTGTFLSMNDITLPGLAAREVVEIYFPESDEYFLFGGAAVMAGTSRLGTSIVMHDITERKKSEQRIIKRNRYLEEANLKLSNYVRIANILEAEKERVKLLEQLQAELINMIENAIDHVHALQNQTYNEITSYHKDIGIFADLLRDIYKQVRKSIRRISGEEGR